MTVRSYRVEMPVPPTANRWWRTAVIPAAKGRPARVNTYLSEEARAYKARYAGFGKRYLIDGDVRVEIVWFRERKSGDLDKRQGVMLDALQGVFYANDSQVAELYTRRSDAEPHRPRLLVTVTSLSDQETLPV